MATPSGILAWKIPWTGSTMEPGGLQCTGVTKSWTRLSDSPTTTTLKSEALMWPRLWSITLEKGL